MTALVVAYLQNGWLILLGIITILQIAVLLHKVRTRRRVRVYLLGVVCCLTLFVPTAIYQYSESAVQQQMPIWGMTLAGCGAFMGAVLLAVWYFASYEKTEPASAAFVEQQPSLPVQTPPPPVQQSSPPRHAQAVEQEMPLMQQDRPTPPPRYTPQVNGMNAWLRDDNSFDRAYQLIYGNNRIGRHSDCEIQLADPSISRFHAQIMTTNAHEYMLQDMGSRTGTYVNGQAVHQPFQLSVGDTIVLGDTTLRFFYE